MSSPITPRVRLQVLYESGIKSVNELAQKTGYKRANVYKLIKKIENSENILKKPEKLQPAKFDDSDMMRLDELISNRQLFN